MNLQTLLRPEVFVGSVVVSAAVGSIAGYALAVKRVDAGYQKAYEEALERSLDHYKKLNKLGQYSTPSGYAEEIQQTVGDDPSSEETQAASIVANMGYATADKNIPVSTITDESVPHVISEEEYLSSEYDYEQESLTWYEEDDVLVGENDIPIEEIDDTVGRANLSRFGEGTKGQDSVFIRNHISKMEYEVYRSSESYLTVMTGGESLQHSGSNSSWSRASVRGHRSDSG